MDNNDIVLSYKNCVLREHDLELLQEPNWLNDNILTFYFEYLESNLPQTIEDTIMFVCPQVTQCLKIVSRSEMESFLDPSIAHSKDLIFFALNDHRTPEKSGGTHWSLLVYSKPDNTLFHFDSHTGSNFTVASKFARTLIPHISVDNKGDLQEADCVQQDNGFDCGIFVIAHTELVLKHFIKYNTLCSIEKLDPTEISSKRREITELIFRLRDEQGGI